LIVIIDTNAYHGDVEVVGQDLTALFDAVANRQTDPHDLEIWTPRGVVEELVRQYSQRAERMARVLGAIKHDLSSFGLGRPAVPSSDEPTRNAYRARLEARLTGTNRKVADHPSDIGKAIDWAAQHRFPVKPKEPEKPPKGEPDLRHFQKQKPTPVTGVVDAAVWLTLIEAARSGQTVALITSNDDDFADPSDKTKLHPRLTEDLRACKLDPTLLTKFRTVREFNNLHVPAEAAKTEALTFLRDGEKKAAVLSEIEDAVEWLPLHIDEAEWNLGVAVDDATLAAFVPSEVSLVRADPASDGFYMTVEADGDARLDLGLWKADAYHVPDDSPVTVYDYDWNESMAAAEAEVPARLTVEIRVKNGDLMTSIEEVAPLAR
jgi:hypothetical protein